MATRAETSGAERIAVTGVTLIDGTGAAPKRDMTVRIENGRITSIAKSGGTVTDAHIIDGRGRLSAARLHRQQCPCFGLWPAGTARHVIANMPIAARSSPSNPRSAR